MLDLDKIAYLQRADNQLQKRMDEIVKQRKLIRKEILMEVFGNEDKSEKQIKSINICINGVLPDFNDIMDNPNR